MDVRSQPDMLTLAWDKHIPGVSGIWGVTGAIFVWPSGGGSSRQQTASAYAAVSVLPSQRIAFYHPSE